MTAFARKMIQETVSPKGRFVIRTTQTAEDTFLTEMNSLNRSGAETPIMRPLTDRSERRAREHHYEWAVMAANQEGSLPRTA